MTMSKNSSFDLFNTFWIQIILALSILDAGFKYFNNLPFNSESTFLKNFVENYFVSKLFKRNLW